MLASQGASITSALRDRSGDSPGFDEINQV
jgi:hypothetical protein